MNDYPSRRDVLIAEYQYRHEAEFGAGFLTDAEIPFLLEADDAGGAYGVIFTHSARIWVRSQDADQARELLEATPNAAVSAEADSSAEERPG